MPPRSSPHSCALAVAVAALAACGQEIVVIDCDAHAPDASAAAGDAATAREDAGAGGADAGPRDGAAPGEDGGGAGDGGAGDGGSSGDDAGSASCGAPYCILALTPSTTRANVREVVTFTPALENPGGALLTFTAVAGDVSGTRRAELPALVPSDVTVSVNVDAAGTVTFSVSEVPPWFTTTTFHVRLRARSTSVGPEVSAEGSVEVRGNVLLSGYSQIYAVASDGRPARSVNFTYGQLVSGASFVSGPKQLVLARDGTLVVYDEGASPDRLRRFELTGENVHLGDLAFQDAMSAPYITGGNIGTGLTQLDDGRFALVVHNPSRTPDSGIVLWNEDGSYDRTLNASNPDIRWQSVAASSTANELLVAEYRSAGRLIRIDPASGLELGVVATDLYYPWSIVAVPGGNVYAGIEGAVLRVTPQGGKTQVSMLMSTSSDYWHAVARFGEGRVLAARDSSSSSTNVVVIDGTTATGYLRPPNVGGAEVLPSGVVYLE